MCEKIEKDTTKRIYFANIPRGYLNSG